LNGRAIIKTGELLAASVSGNSASIDQIPNAKIPDFSGSSNNANSIK